MNHANNLNDVTEVFKAWVQKSITDPMIASTERHIEAFLVDIMLNKMYMMEILRYTHIRRWRRSTALILNYSTEMLVCGIRSFDVLRYTVHGRPATRWLECRIMFSAIFKLNCQKIVANKKISDIVVNPPLCRPGSPALGIESSEGGQTHSSCGCWWRLGPCHH